MGPTFENGTGDYVTLFEPTASEYVNAGKGHIVASVGEYSGEIPYTSFIALESFIKNKSDICEKFVKALYKALNYTKTASSDEVATYLHKHFKTTSVTSLKASVESYKRIDAWMTDMSLNEEMFNKLVEVITNAGENVSNINFNDVVDNTIAKKLYVNS